MAQQAVARVATSRTNSTEVATSELGLTAALLGLRRDNPGREVTLTVQRGLDTKPFPLPVTPDLAPHDNGGVIGVKLGANAKVCISAPGRTVLLYISNSTVAHQQQYCGCSSIVRCDGICAPGAPFSVLPHGAAALQHVSWAWSCVLWTLLPGALHAHYVPLWSCRWCAALPRALWKRSRLPPPSLGGWRTRSPQVQPREPVCTRHIVHTALSGLLPDSYNQTPEVYSGGVTL